MAIFEAFGIQRLIVCRNPLPASERERQRLDLLAGTERELDNVVAGTRRERLALRGKDWIAVRADRAHDIRESMTITGRSHRRRLVKTGKVITYPSLILPSGCGSYAFIRGPVPLGNPQREARTVFCTDSKGCVGSDGVLAAF
ncbi:MAG: hypothetical protein OXT72_02305 [Gammaproteobacteria bacterium]|nr:hypothetical protein [Gammaproteobacteria bacterium]MDE0247182.1 hypothetical protein [Gammaproteobacteria bacterium]